MIKAEQIPDEVVDAAIDAMSDCGSEAIGSRMASAAIAAALNAWPGMAYDPGALVTDAYRDPGKIILPLTENGNE